MTTTMTKEQDEALEEYTLGLIAKNRVCRELVEQLGYPDITARWGGTDRLWLQSNDKDRMDGLVKLLTESPKCKLDYISEHGGHYSAWLALEH